MGISKASKLKADLVYFSLISALLVTILIISVQLIANAEERAQIDSNFKDSRDVISNEDVLKQIDISNELIYDTTGIASHYAKRFHRRKTANGERFNMYKLSAAHRYLPFGTILRVTNLKSGKKVLVRVNDRGPFLRKRIIDLSYESAKLIDGLGLSEVKVEGFIDEKFKQKEIKDTTQDYFYAYSYEHDLLCIPEEFISLSDTLNNFNDAVQKYEEYSNASGFYLFVHAGKKVKKQTTESDSIYFIGTIDKAKLEKFKQDIIIAGF